MARVTVRNNTAGRYLVPSPIAKKLNLGETKSFNGISVDDMEKSAAFKQAITDGSITVTTGEDPSIPNSIEGTFVVKDFLAGRGANLRTDEFTNPVVADTDAIKLSIATAATPRTFSGTALNGIVGQGEMVPPRNPTITSTANAHVTAVACVISGFVRDETGTLVATTCTITTTNGGGVTDAGDRPMSIITSITVPAMGGGAGALEFGFGTMLGLAAKIKSRAGLIAPLRQVAVGAVVTTGTFTNPTGYVVTGYTPASAPDGTRDYACTYEVG